MTARELADLMHRRRVLVEKEFRQSSRGLGISALRFCKERLTATVYAIPEDTTRTGKKKWRRTGQLRRSERLELPDPYTVHIINDVRYSEPRHEAGKPGRRRINPVRVSHWRDDLREAFKDVVPEVRRQTVLAILKAEQR